MATTTPEALIQFAAEAAYNAQAGRHCPSWCQVDHESGAIACQTERCAVVRVPVASSRDVSSVHAFRTSAGSDLRLCIGGEFFTLDAAREYADKIAETCTAVTMKV